VIIKFNKLYQRPAYIGRLFNWLSTRGAKVFIAALMGLRQNLNVKLEAKQNLSVGLESDNCLGTVLEVKLPLLTELKSKQNLNVKMGVR